MGQPGRKLAEREQPATRTDHGVAVAPAEVHTLQQMRRHREPAAEFGGEVGRGQSQEGEIADRVNRGAVTMFGLLMDEELRRTAVRAALIGPGRFDLGVADEPCHPQRAGQQEVETRGGLALADDRRPAGVVLEDGVLVDPVQLFFAEVLEKEEPAQFFPWQNAHCSSR
jgi:hypothetical protein